METPTSRRALVAMSGGVDSSVAAWLLQQQGYDCIGVTMKLYQNETVGLPQGHTCCSLDDVEDARGVARRLGIPYYVFNFDEAFREKVMDKFVRVYEQGGTPNPCIDCNRFLKFEKLLHRARELGRDYVATGHYARIEYDPSSGRYLLKKALDAGKDQSYVLYMLTQEQLSHILFPLGELTKEKVRQMAQEQGFSNARKHDSQDICFVPDGDYGAFLERYTGKRYPEGNFLDRNGAVVGRHRGAVRYTLGQRRGLDLPMGERVYVCGKDMAANTVTVGPDSALYTTALTARDMNWISIPRPDGPLRVKAKTRYRQTEQPATLYPEGEDGVRLEFDQPQRAVTVGQAVVLYDGDTVVGGGTIWDVPSQERT
jgi:tRNA-specific 2-thiouridylase